MSGYKKVPPPVAPKPGKFNPSADSPSKFAGLPTYRPVVFKNPELEQDDASDLPPPPPPITDSDLVGRDTSASLPPPSNSAPQSYIAAGEVKKIEQQMSGYLSKPSSGGGASSEAEVDALTNLLMASMNAASDPDFYGICGVCEQKVIGEKNGCTAMEKIFHITCFTCHICKTQLRSRPFFVVDEKAHCEDCYMGTLEKCCKCQAPISDRILRATGKPYHPGCFTCTVCDVSLDGLPFTVDAANAIHCVDCFNQKFAPRCCVCHDPILPEPGQQETVRVVALDRSFHVACYKCEDCGVGLSSEAEGAGCYPLDGHVLCKACNASRLQRLTA